MPEQQTGRTVPALDRPIFVVGTGRCGSTIFHRILSEHPGLAWQSPLCSLFPAHPVWNRALMRTIDWPLAGQFLRRRFKPGETYVYWDYHVPGFSEPCRDLLQSDATLSNKRRIPPLLAQLVTSKKRRLLVKLTGWPRVGYLRELFPDAKFIHVYRDGRAVANSLLAVDFWRGWRGPAGWRWGELDHAQQAEWERHGKSFVALAGIQWKLLMSAMDDVEKNTPPGNLMQVRYENFIEDPMSCFREVASFCELDWSGRFEGSIDRHKLKAAANDKWKRDLSTQQQAILEAVLADSLQRYGYATGRKAALRIASAPAVA